MRVACVWFEDPAPTQLVAEQCLRFSPQICLRETKAVFIEIGKCKRLYTERGFFARMQVVLRRMNLSASLAIGDDIAHALVLAKYASDEAGRLPLAALLDLADPFDRDPVLQTHVTQLIENFRDLGIKNLAQFKEIPLPELTTRFGPVGILCRQRARGEMGLPWPNWKPEEIISEKVEFPYFEFYGEPEPILFELKKQLDQIFRRLYARNLKAQKMSVKIFVETTSQNPEKFRQFDFEFLFSQSTTKGTLNVIKERLFRDFQRLPIISPIEGLETTVTSTVPGELGQKNLLHANEETTALLHSLLNHLTETHGQDTIFHAELTEDRRPEKSWKKATATELGLLSDEAPLTPSPIQGRIPTRPTYLMKPEKIQVTQGFVHIRKKLYKIAKFSEAVERISGGWVENQDGKITNGFDRNYYTAELSSGATISFFETPEKEFYLHGYFG